MKNETAIVSRGLLVACLAAFVGVSSALKCYDCTSSTTPTCSERVFVSLGIPITEGCACCIKQVSSSGTSRECAEPLVSYKCDNPSVNNYICSSDLCNSANRDDSSNVVANSDGNRIAIATLMTSLMINFLIARFF